MKKFAITIEDHKSEVFLENLQELSFIKSIEDFTTAHIPESHKNIVRDRIAKYDNKIENYLDWDNMEDHINFDA